MSDSFQIIIRKTFPLFFTFIIFGICSGHTRRNKNIIMFLLEVCVCKIICIFLLIHMSIFAWSYNTFNIDSDIQNIIDFILRVSLWVVIPSNIFNGNKFRIIASKIMTSINIYTLNFYNDMVFIYLYLMINILDCLLWFNFFYKNNFFETFYDFYQSKFESNVNNFTFIKYGIIIKLVEFSLIGFYKRLSKLESKVIIVKNSESENLIESFSHLRKEWYTLNEYARDISNMIGYTVLVLMLLSLIYLANVLYIFLFGSFNVVIGPVRASILFFVLSNVGTIAYFTNNCTRIDLQVSRLFYLPISYD